MWCESRLYYLEFYPKIYCQSETLSKENCDVMCSKLTCAKLIRSWPLAAYIPWAIVIIMMSGQTVFLKGVMGAITLQILKGTRGVIAGFLIKQSLEHTLTNPMLAFPWVSPSWPHFYSKYNPAGCFNLFKPLALWVSPSSPPPKVVFITHFTHTSWYKNSNKKENK